MNVRFPLYAKILLWFFLNLLLLSVVLYGFFRAQFHFGLDSLLNSQAGERVQSVSSIITSELASPKSEWNDILKRFSDAYPMQFYLFRNNDGVQVAGEKVELPPEVQAKVIERRGPPWGQGGGGFRPPGEDFQREFRRDGQGQKGPPRDPDAARDGTRPEPPPDGPRREGGRMEGTSREGGGGPFRGEQPEFRQSRPNSGLPGPNNKVMIHTLEPSRYWVLVRIPVFDRERARPSPVSLLIMSTSLSGGGMFFDVVPWLEVGLGVIFFSVLFWLPLVRGITRSISQMTKATEQVAEGHFDTRVNDTRKDELGRLGSAVNRMASRLSGFVMGQKRFLGDIAHELCSPIARVQVALGILEQRATENQKAYVEDVREEVQHMSTLVNELLSFSKAGLKPKSITVEPVSVATIAKRAAAREAEESDRVEVNIPENIHALAEPELLLRAISNLIRNAIRYAGQAGPITVSATHKEDAVTITVADCGPGVPEAMLQQIFDPFFRLESSRNRETGGIGLGLAIVKTCVESCQGSISVKNRTPSGLQVEITLKAYAGGKWPEQTTEMSDGKS